MGCDGAEHVRVEKLVLLAEDGDGERTVHQHRLKGFGGIQLAALLARD